MERFGYFSTFMFVVLIALLPGISICRSMLKTMQMIAPKNRKMPVWAAWLLLLPVPIIGNLIWIIVPYKYAESLGLELKERGIVAPAFPTLKAALALSITSFLAYFTFMHGFTRYAWFIFFAIFWYQVAVNKRKLEDALTTIG
jgi:hypothetical protein